MAIAKVKVMLLPALIRDAMARLGLSREDVISRLGYRMEAKAARRLDAWLSGFDVPRDAQVERLADALELTTEEIEAAIAGPKGRYRLSMRLMRGFIGTEYLAADLTLEQALEAAGKRARALNVKVALSSPDGRTHWLDESGQVGRVSDDPPRMTIGRQSVTFVCQSKSGETR